MKPDQKNDGLYVEVYKDGVSDSIAQINKMIDDIYNHKDLTLRQFYGVIELENSIKKIKKLTKNL